MKVWVYSGLPGAGKTRLIGQRHPEAPVCSSDHHFENDGVYLYVPSEIGLAHAKCLRRFVDFVRMIEPPADLVVDNTNTTTAEIAPYAALALAYGHELQIVTVLTDLALSYSRNLHGVSFDTMLIMDAQLRKRELAPWWPHEVVQ